MALLERVSTLVRANLNDLIDRAREAGLQPRVAALAAERSGIVMLPNADPSGAVRRLSEAGIGKPKPDSPGSIGKGAGS